MINANKNNLQGVAFPAHVEDASFYCALLRGRDWAGGCDWLSCGGESLEGPPAP